VLTASPLTGFFSLRFKSQERRQIQNFKQPQHGSFFPTFVLFYFLDEKSPTTAVFVASYAFS